MGRRERSERTEEEKDKEEGKIKKSKEAKELWRRKDKERGTENRKIVEAEEEDSGGEKKRDKELAQK